MKSVQFVGQTTMMAKPDCMSDEECGPLPICKEPDGRMVSVWRPTPEELTALNTGAHVILHIFAPFHPPVALTVQKMEEIP